MAAVLATISPIHATSTPQQIIDNYLTGKMGNAKNYTFKTDSKGCEEIWDGIPSTHGGSEIMVYQYCPTK